MKFSLSKSQRQELLAELRIERERKFVDRIRVILLIDEGKKYKDIAAFLFLDEKTILNWKRRYEQGGVEKMVNDHYMGRVCLLNPHQLSQLEMKLEAQVFPTTEAVVTFVNNEFCVAYTTGGMTSLEKENNQSF